MIVQTAPEGEPHFVILQVDHTRLAGDLARGWGNASFVALEPRDLMEFAVTHHDQGWEALDQRFLQDPDTGLPYHLVKTPLPDLVSTSAGSPDYCEPHHPFCGLISSMHSYGLYNGRYGMTDFLFIEVIPDELRPQVDTMLDGELSRQERLKAQLSSDPDTAAWAEEDRLFHNYKLLQFFDTLALYLQCDHPADRVEAEFPNVPRALGDDVTVEVVPLDEATYRLDPFPFGAEPFVVATAGRYMESQPPGADLAALFAGLAPDKQTVNLVG